jgi:hypothetical protein
MTGFYANHGTLLPEEKRKHKPNKDEEVARILRMKYKSYY